MSYAKVAHDDGDATVPTVGIDVDRPRPPIWKRAVLVALLAIFLGLALYLRPGARSQPKVIHASRYSKEFKFRPAASPVITERLKDGRVRLRGALPT